LRVSKKDDGLSLRNKMTLISRFITSSFSLYPLYLETDKSETNLTKSLLKAS